MWTYSPRRSPGSSLVIPFICVSLQEDLGVRRRRTAPRSFRGRRAIHATHVRKRSGARVATRPRSRPAHRRSRARGGRTRCSDPPVALPRRRSRRSSPARRVPTGPRPRAARRSLTNARRRTSRRRRPPGAGPRRLAPRTGPRGDRASRAKGAPRSSPRRSRRSPAGTSTHSFASGGRTAASAASLVVLDPQHGEKRLLGDLHRPHHLHPLLAFLLLVEELSLARDVAAVALPDHVLALGAHVLARDDLPADLGLHAHVEHRLADDTAQLR